MLKRWVPGESRVTFHVIAAFPICLGLAAKVPSPPDHPHDLEGLATPRYDGQFRELVPWCSVSTRAQKLSRARCLSFSSNEQCSAAEGTGLLQSGPCHRLAQHPSQCGCLWYHQICQIKESEPLGKSAPGSTGQPSQIWQLAF